MTDLERGNKKKYLSLREVLFFFCLAVFGIRQMFFRETLWRLSFPALRGFEETILDLYTNYLPWLLLTCILFAFFSVKPDILKILFCLLLVFIGQKVATVQGDVYFYLGVLFLVAAFGISAKRILVFWMSFNIPLLIATIIASRIGLIENWIELGRNREYLGYGWTTTPVMIFAYAVFEYLIVRMGKISLPEFLIINMVNFWLFIKTNTRFAFLIVLLVTGFMMFVDFSSSLREKLKQSRLIMILLPWLFCILVYVTSVFYNPSNAYMYKLNKLLSNRLKQCQYSLGVYPILKWGQIIEFVQTKYATDDNPATYVDTAYLQVLLRYGWVALLAFLIISSYIMYRAYSEKKPYIALVFAAVLVFGLFEQQLYWFQFNLILMLTFADYSSLLTVDWMKNEKTEYYQGVKSEY